MRVIALMFFILFHIHLFSQKKSGYAIGLSMHSTDALLKQDVGVTIGHFYKKNYSQIKVLYGYSMEPGILNAYSTSFALSKSLGFGVTQRYYPNKNKSFFSSFFEADLRLSRNSCENVDPNINYFLSPLNVERNMLGLFFGYGISLNLPYNLTLLHSIGFGKSYIFGKNIYYYNNEFLYDDYKILESDYSLNISILYNLKKSKASKNSE